MKKPLSIVSRARVIFFAVLLVAVPAALEAAPLQPAQQTQLDLAVKVGVGGGLPYGVFGAGIDVGIPHFSFVAGLGSAFYGGLGWSVGVRAYLFNRARRFRPHLTAMYGSTMVIKDPPYKGETVNGFGFYAGLDHDVGPVGGLILTYGVGVLTNEVPPPGVEDPRFSVRALLGINYRFGGRK